MNKGASSVFSLKAHLVMVVKYRKPVIDEDLNQYLKDSFVRIGQEHFIDVISWNYDPILKDHIHVLIDYSPKTHIDGFLAGYKGATSRYISRNRDDIKSQLFNNKFWTRGYFISSVGNGEENLITKYIENQGPQKHVRGDKGFFIQSSHEL